MPIRVLFADDQLPSDDPVENERTRSEIRRERPDIADFDRAFDEDFAWFEGLLDYLRKTKGAQVIAIRRFADALAAISRTDDYDVAVVDMSWFGDASLRPGRAERHNRGLDLVDRVAELQKKGAHVAAIALSQNFRDDFELMTTVLQRGALPVPKSYEEVGHRALYAAIEYLAKISAEARASASPVKLFISHAHRDRELAALLVEAIGLAMEVPRSAIRCTSVPGYELDLGAMPADVLRRELSSTTCVIALLTPHSLASEWCQFELGAAWVLAKETLPLLAGRVRSNDLPAAFRGAAAGEVADLVTLQRLLDQLRARLGWPERSNRAESLAKLKALADRARHDPPTRIEDELARPFAERREGIGPTQRRVLDYVVRERGARDQVPQAELYERFKDVPTGLFYRLEQLRCLGFLSRSDVSAPGDAPEFVWGLSPDYAREIE
jgi:hypothetical protein